MGPLFLHTKFHHDLQLHAWFPEPLWICSKEMCLLNPTKPWIQWGLNCLMKTFRWASSWQNILYRYLQNKATKEVSETPWKWCPFTNQDPDCEIPTPPPTEKKEPKEKLNPNLKILEFTLVISSHTKFSWYIFPCVCHSGMFLILFSLNNFDDLLEVGDGSIRTAPVQLILWCIWMGSKGTNSKLHAETCKDSECLTLKNREILVCEFGSPASETANSTGRNTHCKKQITQSVKNVLASFEMKE